MTTTKTIEPIKLFISYSHRDEELQKELLKELSPFKRQGMIEIWHDRMLDAGDEWKKAIDERLNDSNVILLLVSRDFINSDYCYEKEMMRAMERHKANDATVIPIILRACNWLATPLKDLQAIPRDDKAITSWSNQDEAFKKVGAEIFEIVAKRRP